MPCYLIEFPDISNISDIIPTQESLIDAFRSAFLIPLDAFYPPTIPGIPNIASLMPDVSGMFTVPDMPNPWIPNLDFQTTDRPSIDALHAIPGIIMGQFFQIVDTFVGAIKDILGFEIPLPTLPILNWDIFKWLAAAPGALLDELMDIYENEKAKWAAIIAAFNLPKKWPTVEMPDLEVMAVLQELTNKMSLLLVEAVMAAMGIVLGLMDDLELAIGGAIGIVLQIVSLITSLPTPSDIVAYIYSLVPPLPSSGDIMAAINSLLGMFGIPPFALPDPLIPNIGFPEFEITHYADQFMTQVNSFIAQLVIDLANELELIGALFMSLLPSIPDYLTIGPPPLSSLCTEVTDGTGLIPCPCPP